MPDQMSDSFINVTPGGSTSLYLRLKLFSAFSISNSAASTPILSATVPAGTLTAESSLLIWVNATGGNTTGGNQSATVTVKFGGTTIGTATGVAFQNSINPTSVYLSSIMSNENTVLAQIYGGSVSYALAGAVAATRVLGGTAAKDTTQDQALEVDWQFTLADPALSVTGGVTVLAIG